MKKLFLLLSFLPLFTLAQDIASKAHELLSAYSDQKKFSGNILIAKNGTVIFEKSYGYRNAAAKQLNERNTEFRAGSLTKMFTSALILKLADEKKIQLEDPLSKYVPNVPYGHKISILHLLSHTSGIAGTSTPAGSSSLEAHVLYFKYDSLAFEPGTQFAYNNFNYILLSYIAEKIMQQPYADLLRQKILQPAGLKNTGIDNSNRISSQQALGYYTNPETTTWEVAESKVEQASGAGALYTTTEDLLIWSKVINSGKIIPLALLEKAQSIYKGNYGMGWIVNNKNGKKSFGHTGAIEGFKAYEMIYPDEDIVIIYLSNYQDLDGRQLADKLEALVFNQPYTIPVQKKTVALNADQLKQLEGTYVLNEHFNVTITVQDQKLFAQASGDPGKIELAAESETKFFLRGPETEVEFIKENGRVVVMFINMQGGMRLQKKV